MIIFYKVFIIYYKVRKILEVRVKNAKFLHIYKKFCELASEFDKNSRLLVKINFFQKTLTSL